MEKKKVRSDADRRARQSERFGRLLRLLALIAGSGRWDSEGLARELECSRRTVHRLLQSLSHAGIPWFFDDDLRAYRVRAGFKFAKTVLDQKTSASTENLLSVSKRFESEMERFLKAIQQFNSDLENSQRK